MSTINPAWTAYNNGMNEGGEGYNPHPKFIASPVASTSERKFICGKMRTRDDALRFAKLALRGEDKVKFLAEVTAAFGA